MSSPKDIQEVYEIMIDEIDVFMQTIYERDREFLYMTERIEEFPEEIQTILKNSYSIDPVLERIENLKGVLKTIAYSNHNLMLFTNEELEDPILRAVIEDDEVF